MANTVEHVSFTLSDEEVKSLNKLRKEYKSDIRFNIRLIPNSIGVKVEAKAESRQTWENITEYQCW